MNNILSGGNGIPSFEDWKKKGGSTAASSNRPNSRKTTVGEGKAPVSIGARLTEELLGGGEGVPSFEDWSKLRHSDASPILPEPKAKKGIFDTSDKSYADSVGTVGWNREEIDGGAQRKAEQLRTAAERLWNSPASRSQVSGKVGRLKDDAYDTEQEGIRNIGEKLAASNPEFLSKARAGYEKPAGGITLSDNSIVGLNRKSTTIDIPNPIQAQRSEVNDAFKGVVEGYAPVAATLDEQLDNINNGLRSQTGIQHMGGVNLTDMTADELKTYSYWYNRSPHAAKRYLESIAPDVNARTAEKESAMLAESTRAMRDTGVAGTVAASLGNIALDVTTSPLAMASAVGAKLQGKTYDPNSALDRTALMGSSMQEGLTGDLPTFGKFLADTGLSTAQFLARIPLGAAGLVVMASGAAGKTANEVKRNGGTTDQALQLGTIAGIAEYVSEKIPFENIAAAFKGAEKKGLVKLIENGIKKFTANSFGQSAGAVVGSALEEGLEELITEYVNNIASDVIMGDDSEMKKYARELVEGGMDYEEACRTAFNQFYLVNPAVSFAGGALSGAVMTGAGEAWNKRGEIGRTVVNTVGKTIDSTVNRARIKNNMSKDAQTNTQTDVQTDAQTTQDGVSKAQNVETNVGQENGTQTQETAQSETQSEPMVNPKDEQFDKNGNFVLKTAEQENRIRRAKASNDDIERSGRLAGASDSEIRIAQRLSKVFGRNIIFDSSDASVNGKFADGTIYVNPKGTDNVSTILAHELTHSLEGTSEYESYKNTLKRSLIDQGKNWDSLLDEIRDEYEPRYANMGQKFTDADCESEAIARATQAVFNDDSSIETFVKQNRNAATRFWHKLTQAVKRFREDITAKRQYDHGALDENERAEQFALRRMEDLRDRFAKALRRTKDAGNGAQMVKHSLAGSALERAKQMEAEDESPFTIKEATGWYRDNEGNWKKEWRKSDDMFDAELPKTEKSADGGLNEALSKPTEQKTQTIDEITQKAKEEFGTTYDWNETGFLLTDGTQLDFSEKRNGGEPGARSADHSQIGSLYNDRGMFEGKMDFMRKGNIRIVPETNSINLIAEPNIKQERALRRYINRARGEVIVDIDDAKGHPAKSLMYDAGTSAAKILSDIHDYFENGSGSQSDIAMFHNMGDQYSIHGDDYGTKAINTAEELNRKKAIDMLRKGKDPQYVYQLTGWFKDDFGNFLVDHGAEVYSYGGNDSEIEAQLRAENETLRQQTDGEETKKSRQLSDKALRAAYERGKIDTQKSLEKALTTKPNMTPEAKAVRKLSREIIGDGVSDSARQKITKRIAELYTRMNDIQSDGGQIWGNEEITKEMDAIATEIQDSRFTTNKDNAAMRDTILKEFKTPMFLSEKARGDFAEGYSKLKKQMGKRMTLVNDRSKGTPVDVRYMELSEQFGDFFPSYIENEADQFATMMDVVKRVSDKNFTKQSYYDFSGWEQVYQDDHAEMMVKLAEGYQNLEFRPKDWADTMRSWVDESFQQMERKHAAELKQVMDQAEKEVTSVLSQKEAELAATQQFYEKRVDDAINAANKFSNDLEDSYHFRVNSVVDDANRRVKNVTDYYEGKERDRINREVEEKQARAQRRHDRGGDISSDKISQSIDDNTFTGKMMRLYEKQKELSAEWAKYADVKFEDLSPEGQEIAGKIRDELDNMTAYINNVHKIVKKVRRDKALRMIATGDIMSWKDKKGWSYDINTEVRNIEDISKGDALGQRMIKEYVEPVHRHEAMKQRFLKSMRERVEKLDLGLEVKAGNKLSESAYVQLLAECRSNIRMLENGMGNAYNKNGEQFREGKTLEEWWGIENQLALDNPNMDMKKIEHGVTVFHELYDELYNLMNQARVIAGYAPVEYHAGYFPHFNNGSGTDSMLADLLSGLGLAASDTDVLPTSINGLTHTFRPGIKYMSNVKQRSIYGAGELYNGFTLTSGAVEGFDRYIEAAADVIYHTEDIQNLRSLSDAIRYSTTDESRKQQVDMIRADSKLSPEEQDSRIGELFENKQHYRLSNFVVNLEEWTNIIAGKKSLRDRQWEQFLGRSMYQGIKKLEQRVAANQVSLNPGSWLTNFVPLTQAGSVLTQKQLLNAMWDTVKATKQSDGFRDRSDFLTNRFGSDRLVQTKADKFAKVLGTPMDIIDGFTAETIVRARYAQNLAKNLSETDAMHEADMFTYKLMANRAKGDMPTIFHASNPLWKLFTQYQLEVDNGIMFMLKDLPKEAKARDPKWAKELVKMLMKMSIGAWLYNEVYEMFVGRRCALDPINIFNDFAGDLTGFKAPGIADVGDAIVGKKNWGDIAKTDRKGVVTAAGNLANNIGAELPFVGGVMFGGGRIPVQSAIPSINKIGSALTGDKALSKRVEMIGKELAKPAAYIIPPFGGGQIKKAIEGTAAFVQGGSYTRDNEGKKKLQYPVENKSVGDAVMNLPRALLFGKTANKYGREWVDDGFGSLSVKATTAYEALVKDGVGQDDAFEQMKKFRALSADHAERADKVAYLRGIECSSEAKRVVFEQMILSSDDSIASAKEKLDSLEDANIKLDYYLDAYETYLRSEGDAKKVSLVNKIQSSGLTSEQKDVLYCCFYREKGLPDTPWHNAGVKKVMANEGGIADLPEIKMPEISMPEIKMPEINMPTLK